MQKLSIKLVLFILVATCIFPVIHSEAADVKKQIQLMAGSSGGTMYQMSYAFSVIVNKYSDKAKIVPMETLSTAANVEKVITNPKGTLGCAPVVSLLQASIGMRPYDKPVQGLKVVGNYTRNIQTWITLDPDIKSIKDLEGKRIGLGPQPSLMGKTMQGFLKSGYGLGDETKFFFMNWGRLKNAIMDGSIDAMVMGISTRPVSPYAPVPVFKEIIAGRKNVHFIPFSKEAVLKTAAVDKLGYSPTVLPKGSIAKNLPAKDIPAWSENLALFAHKDLDSDLVYEFTRILYEHCKEMQSTTAVAKAIWPEIISNIYVKDDMIHEGALRYYEEKKLR